MGFSLSQPGKRIPPIAIEPIGGSQNQMPPGAIGFNYWLIGAGGGGGLGGDAIGGGGGGAGQLTSGTVLLSEIFELFLVTTAAGISIEFDLGLGGGGGTTVKPYGDRGGDSKLIIKSTVQNPLSQIVLAAAIGGYGGLKGTDFQGFGFGELGTTHSVNGGLGELSGRKEYRSQNIDRTSTALNRCGDGGNGGSAGTPGFAGKPGWASIAFF